MYTDFTVCTQTLLCVHRLYCVYTDFTMCTQTIICVSHQGKIMKLFETIILNPGIFNVPLVSKTRPNIMVFSMMFKPKHS